MIDYIRYRNFQNHVDTRVDLDPMLTTIIGPSDAGKSALLRGLKWVSLNLPGGTGFIRHGSEDANVEVGFEGHAVSRIRGKQGNIYRLDGEEFRAFGSNVPDTIANLFNVGPTNFQGQHDPVFWFAESAGEVSRRLNAVVDLGIIDESLATIGAKVRHYQSEAKVCKDRLDKARAKRDGLTWVIEADIQYTEVERLAGELTNKSTQKAALGGLLQMAKDSRDRQQTQQQLVAALRVVGMAGVACIQAAEKTQKLASILNPTKSLKTRVDAGYPDTTKLQSTFEVWNESQSRKWKLGRLVEESNKSAKAAKAPPDYTPVLAAYSALDSIHTRMERLEISIHVAKNRTELSGREIPDTSRLDAALKSYNEAAAKRAAVTKAIQGYFGVFAIRQKKRAAEILAKQQFEQESGGLCPICGGQMNG